METIFCGIPYCSRIVHSAGLWTQSNALRKSTKFTIIGRCPSVAFSIICLNEKIWSMHDLPGLNSACLMYQNTSNIKRLWDFCCWRHNFICFWEAILSFVHLKLCRNLKCVLIHSKVYKIHSSITVAKCYCSSAACQLWSAPQANTNYANGQANAATTIQACQTACAATAGCNGVDWVTTAAQGAQCWLSGTWSGARGSAANVNHYVYNRNCASKKFYILL